MFCRYEVRFKILWAKFCKKKERTHICTPLRYWYTWIRMQRRRPRWGDTPASFLFLKIW